MATPFHGVDAAAAERPFKFSAADALFSMYLVHWLACGQSSKQGPLQERWRDRQRDHVARHRAQGIEADGGPGLAKVDGCLRTPCVEECAQVGHGLVPAQGVGLRLINGLRAPAQLK